MIAETTENKIIYTLLVYGLDQLNPMVVLFFIKIVTLKQERLGAIVRWCQLKQNINFVLYWVDLHTVRLSYIPLYLELLFQGAWLKCVALLEKDSHFIKAKEPTSC